MRTDITYLRGNYSFESCFFCDKEITEDNPGYKVTYVQHGKKYQAHVCKDEKCFDAEFKKAVSEMNGTISNFFNSYGSY